ncbi:MAG: efflux RND transporter periplasmic adaptor subunit [Alphaproteobacteria bacterium]|nr:efflux RND transporter periplasmic adaptor subunit [Alphaproteobacteria bacterium]
MKKKVSVDVIKNLKLEKGAFMNKKYLFFGAAILLAAVAGCHFYGQKNAQGGMPAINVTSAVAEEIEINNPKTYVALVEAINSVDVVAKVSGSLDKVNFKEGGYVTKDEPLFVIDKDRYQANYNLAAAQLESAKANLTKTERDFKRQKQLSAKNIASKATFDSAESAYLQAKAAVAQAEAQLELAKIDLDNTEVKAYIDGFIGKTKVTVGNYVNASAEPLARVVQVNPIRIAFSLTDKEFLEMKAAGERDLNDFVVNIELASGEIFSEKLDKVFANNEINMGTATVAVYADINNDKGLLKPGAYVKMFITSAQPKKGIVVPEVSIIQNEENSQVYVITADNTVALRNVKLGDTYDGKQVIESGLKAGEKVVVGGQQNRMMRPGAAVKEVEAK